MSVIGTFVATTDGYVGTIRTLSWLTQTDIG